MRQPHGVEVPSVRGERRPQPQRRRFRLLRPNIDAQPDLAGRSPLAHAIMDAAPALARGPTSVITLAAPSVVNSGDTGWVMVCTALVLFMTPGLALFYAGMDRPRNALVMLQQNLIPSAWSA